MKFHTVEIRWLSNTRPEVIPSLPAKNTKDAVRKVAALKGLNIRGIFQRRQSFRDSSNRLARYTVTDALTSENVKLTAF